MTKATGEITTRDLRGLLSLLDETICPDRADAYRDLILSAHPRTMADCAAMARAIGLIIEEIRVCEVSEEEMLRLLARANVAVIALARCLEAEDAEPAVKLAAD